MPDARSHSRSTLPRSAVGSCASRSQSSSPAGCSASSRTARWSSRSASARARSAVRASACATPGPSSASSSGQHPPPHPDAGEPVVGVVRIGPGGRVRVRSRRAGSWQHAPRAADGRNAPAPADMPASDRVPGTTGQAQQDGLGLVVERVAEQDPFLPRSGGLQRGVAGGAGRRLGSASVVEHPDRAHDRGDTERVEGSHHTGGHLRGSGLKSVVDHHRSHSDSVPEAHQAGGGRQRQGVGAARTGDQHGCHQGRFDGLHHLQGGRAERPTSHQIRAAIAAGRGSRRASATTRGPRTHDSTWPHRRRRCTCRQKAAPSRYWARLRSMPSRRHSHDVHPWRSRLASNASRMRAYVGTTVGPTRSIITSAWPSISDITAVTWSKAATCAGDPIRARTPMRSGPSAIRT